MVTGKVLVRLTPPDLINTNKVLSITRTQDRFHNEVLRQG